MRILFKFLLDLGRQCLFIDHVESGLGPKGRPKPDPPKGPCRTQHPLKSWLLFIYKFIVV